MDRREHHRAQLSLPARLRWNTPLGQKTEVCRTLDISRGGLLVPCKEAHGLGVPLWVTFPYDSSLVEAQPEVLAKVVRVATGANGSNGLAEARHGAASKGTKGTDEYELALHFQPRLFAENGNGHAKEHERRSSPRRPLAVPLRVRPDHVPWFEEAMTLDVSSQSLRFLSNREYSPGSRLLVSFEPSTSVPWPAGAENSWRVVRVERMPQGAALAVTLTRQS